MSGSRAPVFEEAKAEADDAADHREDRGAGGRVGQDRLRPRP